VPSLETLTNSHLVFIGKTISYQRFNECLNTADAFDVEVLRVLKGNYVPQKYGFQAVLDVLVE